MKNPEELKQLLGETIAARVENNQTIAFGTGTTVNCAITEIGKRMKAEDLSIQAVSSSIVTSRAAMELGIPVLDMNANPRIDWGFDGADEVTPGLEAIKGGGAAMYAEKCLALRCPHWILIADYRKKVETLGAKPIPLEVEPTQLQYVIDNLPETITSYKIREGSGAYGPVCTTRGNIVLDVFASGVNEDLAVQLSVLHGVLGHGIFLSEAHEVIIAEESGELTIFKK